MDLLKLQLASVPWKPETYEQKPEAKRRRVRKLRKPRLSIKRPTEEELYKA